MEMLNSSDQNLKLKTRITVARVFLFILAGLFIMGSLIALFGALFYSVGSFPFTILEAIFSFSLLFAGIYSYKNPAFSMMFAAICYTLWLLYDFITLFSIFNPMAMFVNAILLLVQLVFEVFIVRGAIAAWKMKESANII